MNEQPTEAETSDAAPAEIAPAESAPTEIAPTEIAPHEIAPHVAASPASPPRARPFAFVTPRVLAGAGVNAAVAVAATIAAALIALFVIVALIPDSDTPFGTPVDASSIIPADLGGVFSTIGLLAGYALGGELRLEVLEAAGANLVLLPLTLIVGIALATSWWGFRAERRGPLASVVERMLASVATGVIAATMITLIAAISTLGSVSDLIPVIVASAGWRVFLTGLVVVAASAMLGRTLAARSDAPWYFTAFVPAVRTATPLVREAVGYTTILIAVFVPITLLVAIIGGIRSESPAATLLSLLLFGANSVAYVAALAHVGSVQFDYAVSAFGTPQTQSGAFWVFSPELGGWSILLVVVALAATAYSAIWVGLRRPRREGIEWARVWQLPAITLIVWAIGAVLALGGTIDASGTMGFISGSFHGGFAPSWWTPLVLALWAGAVSVGAEFTPAFVYSISPETLGRLGGRRATAAWLTGSTTTSAAAVAMDAGPVGVGVDAAPNQADVAPVRPPTPMDPARRRRLLLVGAIVGGVALLAVASVVTVNLLNSSRTAQARVAEYVGHIANGDADLASAAVDPNVPTDERDLLTDGALAGAAQRIGDVRTTVVAIADDIATIGVTYRLDGVDEYAELRAERGPNEFGVLETWRVIDPLVAQVEVFTDVFDELAVGAVDVAIEGGESSATRIVYVYPGIYEVSAPENDYYSSAPTMVRATGAVGSSITFAEVYGEPTDALTDEISRQVNARIDECAKSVEAAPDGCPLSTWAADDAEVTWTVVEYPEVEMSGAASFQTVGGEVAYAYTYTFFGSEITSDGTRRPSMYGGVSLDDGEPVITFEG